MGREKIVAVCLAVSRFPRVYSGRTGMNTPPFLVAAVLLFWGWQTGHLVIGAIAGGMLESSRFIRARWSLTQADFNRLWNFCTVLFLGVGIFLVINEGTTSFNDFFANSGRRPEAIRQAGKSALVWFQWFPMMFLPFLLAQAFNDRPTVGLATFSWWLRKQEARFPNPNLPREGLNVAYPYVALGLLAASATTGRGPFFYYGVALLVAWALWPRRPRRQSVAGWGVLFLVIAGAGYAGHTGLFRLQKKLEEMNMAWFSRFSALGLNDKETRTQLGSIGELKMSGQILLRLRTDGGAPPELLREASYNLYRAPAWTAGKRAFGGVLSENDLSTWKFLPQKTSRRSLTVAGYFRRGEGLLPLALGSSEVLDLPVGEVATNRFGAARMQGGPGLAIYQTRYDQGQTFDSAPALEDFRTYEENEPALVRIAAELKLHGGLSAPEAMRRIAALFQEKFQYATYLGAGHAVTSNETALARFLLHTRSGHCEYFATATTLLLRHAGVPTRYAVGYSVQEGSGRKYVVRARHAHAWTLVYHGGAWHDFDTTPSSWSAVETTRESFLQPIKDFFSDLWFQFSKFRWSKTEWRKYFMWAPLPLVLLVLARFVLGKRWRRLRAKPRATSGKVSRPGTDSDFYLIEKHFAARGLERAPGENWSDWFRRLARHENALAGLQPVLTLHQRHRFDPRGLTEPERAELRRQVVAWLAGRVARP